MCDERDVRVGGHGSRGVWIAVALALAQTALLAVTAWDKSDTADESEYVAAAATLWANGDVGYLCGAPVLPRWGAALALAAVDPAVTRTPRDEPLRYVLADVPPERLRAVLFAVRLPTILIVVAGGLVVASAARRFGSTAAVLTHALWCFSPTVLANGSLATLDAWAAAFLCMAAWALLRGRERFGAASAAILGVACGAAAASKITALGFVPVAALAILVGVPRGARATTLATAAVAFLATIWATYAFTVGPVHVGMPCEPDGGRVVGPLPFPAWIEGVLFQLRHGRIGHLGYLCGMVGTHGWWWFYLVCLVFKPTVGAQALALLRGGAALVRRPPRASLALDAMLLTYPLMLLVFLSAGSHQGGVAFLLPAFPFVMLWTGHGIGDVVRAFGRRGRAVMLACVALGAVEALCVHPHYLMFFNLWAGGPSGGPRYLVHRDDWGQDDRRLAVWQRRHHVARLYFAAYGPNAARWGVVGEPVPCTPTAGVYALHAIEVHRPQFSLSPGCIDWLTVEPPDERLGYSIYVYIVDDARLARLRDERAVATPFWRSGAAPARAVPSVAFPERID